MLDEVKVRAAYGQTGNKPQYGDKFTQLTVNTYEGIPSISLPTRITASLRPERQAEIFSLVLAVPHQDGDFQVVTS